MSSVHITILISCTSRIPYLMGLYQALSNLGLSCAVCTDLVGLRPVAPQGRGRHALVVDGVGEAASDPLLVLSGMPSRMAARYVVVLRDDCAALRRLRGCFEPDLVLSEVIEPAAFAEAVCVGLEEWGRQAYGGMQAVRREFAGGAGLGLASCAGGGAAPAAAICPAGEPPAGEAVWVLDEARCRLTAPNGRRMRLSQCECALLRLFALAGDACLAHEAVERATLAGHSVSRRYLAALISRLRQKAGARNAVLPIRSRHGQGYEFHATMKLAAQAELSCH